MENNKMTEKQNPAYPPPPPAYHPGQPQHSTTVVYQQPAFVAVQTFRESPVRTKCPSCSADVVTSTTYETGTFTWVICLVLAFFGPENLEEGPGYVKLEEDPG
ncbi:hypothetical protein KUTeg_012027 [Tegillarca granosa]|uniref:LITAF domain-containing protein n=1 Tax=Tegillarca granosa TaxID=220873 RepID=A0ABQ9EYC4_TEGGR|nr:hypothetical protein KUTeg_012027 [Tegillarca granosa]